MVNYSMKYHRPEMMGTIIVEDDSSGIDWSGIVETLCVVVGGVFLVMFGDQQMISSFIAAFVITLVLARGA